MKTVRRVGEFGRTQKSGAKIQRQNKEISIGKKWKSEKFQLESEQII